MKSASFPSTGVMLLMADAAARKYERQEECDTTDTNVVAVGVGCMALVVTSDDRRIRRISNGSQCNIP